MFNRQMFLGQVPLNLGQAEIRPGTGFQPGPIYWPGGYGSPQAPASGAPTTREIVAPGGWSSTKHCYQMPDGTYRTLTMDQAASMEAAGIAVAAVDARNCPGFNAVTAPPAAVMAGRNRLGQNGGPSGGPGGPSGGGSGAPTVSVAPTVHNGGISPQNLEFTFWYPGWPNYQYQYPQPPYNPNRRMICRRLEERSEEEGRDVLECEYEQVERVAPFYNAPVITYPMTRYSPFF